MKKMRVHYRHKDCRHGWLQAAVLLMLLLSLEAVADIVETTVQMPVHILRARQPDLRQNIVVTVLRDDSHQRGPVALLAHGRPVTPQDRARMGQVKYPGNALWLAEQGFVVVVPTRIGYGVSGGPDLDASGDCLDKNYLNALSGAVSQYRQVLVTMARQAYVDPGHSIIIGESFGGLVAIALASENGITGLKGVVNMAGGDGGDYSHLDQPCAPDRLANSLAALGKKNRLPTLWMYSLNDRFWGPLYPQQWFQAFTAAGGRGEFVQMPADKNNGHFIFNRNVLAWHADMERFLSAVAANPATARH